MAAANLQGKRAIGLGKRLTNQIWAAPAARDPAPLPSPAACAAARRAVQASAYDRNPEDDHQVRPSTVPDDVIKPESDKYWGPHPTTGVFGPAGSDRSVDPASADGTPGGSVLDQAAWFRPQEDVDKPPPHA